ncbi:MAG: hypothetical protein P8J14_10690 [Emcibacteraceae bacterium]|nr:hypothetical protein [Emcibacteraceae bacterium]
MSGKGGRDGIIGFKAAPGLDGAGQVQILDYSHYRPYPFHQGYDNNQYKHSNFC